MIVPVDVVVSVDVLPESVDEFLLDESLPEAAEAATVAKPDLNPSTVSLDELAAVDAWTGVPAIAAGRARDAVAV